MTNISGIVKSARRIMRQDIGAGDIIKSIQQTIW